MLAENYMETYKNWDSEQLQLGRGFSVKLTYYSGAGEDSEGETFEGGSHTLHQDDLTGSNGLSKTGGSPIAMIIKKHENLWRGKLRTLQ